MAGLTGVLAAATGLRDSPALPPVRWLAFAVLACACALAGAVALARTLRRIMADLAQYPQDTNALL